MIIEWLKREIDYLKNPDFNFAYTVLIITFAFIIGCMTVMK